MALKKLFKRAIRIRDRRDSAEIGPHGLMVSIGQVESQMDRLLGGNNTLRGAHTQEVLMIVLHPARKRGVDALVAQALRNPASIDPVAAVNRYKISSATGTAQRRRASGRTLPAGAIATILPDASTVSVAVIVPVPPLVTTDLPEAIS